MFTSTGCTVTLADGTVLRRQRVALDSDGIFRSFDKRGQSPTVEAEVLTTNKQGRSKWVLTTAGGDILVAKSGCGCGR